MNNTQDDEYYLLRDIIYELGDIGPKVIHICVSALELIEAKLSDDDFDFDNYTFLQANDQWDAAFQDIGSYERITDPAVIAALPETYNFVRGCK